MKKTLIALAVLSSVASAQAQVTLYGIADVWLGRAAATDAAGVKTNSTQMTSGGLSGSRIGFTGEKALGNGLTGVFKFEQGFNLDTGLNKDEETTFNRQAYVGLTGGFGQVTLGNTWTAMDDVLGAGNSGFDSALSASNNVLQVPALYASNPGNTIKYTSPSMGGFSAAASYSLSEKDDTGVATDPKVADFSVSYAAGPLATNLAYQQQKVPGATDAVKLTALNGSYDLGVVKLLASFGQAKTGAAKSTDLQFGADVPVNAKLTVSAGYAMSEDNAAAGNAERSGLGVAVAYSLADATTMYGGMRQAKTKNTSIKDNVFAVGIKHAF